MRLIALRITTGQEKRRMFIKAGFNPRRRRIVEAKISVAGRFHGWAQLVRFVDSGELAWRSRFGYYWPEEAIVHSAPEWLRFRYSPWWNEAYRPVGLDEAAAQASEQIVMMQACLAARVEAL